MKEAEQIGIWNQTLHNKYENIDAKATQIFLAAESRCLPRDAGLQMRYYNTYKQLRKRKAISQAILLRMATQAKLKHMDLTHHELDTKVTQTKNSLQEIKTKHKEYRKNPSGSLPRIFQGRFSDSSTGNPNYNGEREYKKNTQNIRHILGKWRRSSLLCLIVPPKTSSKNEPSKIYTTKDEIHDHILAYNISHYSKGGQSPLGINKPLYDRIGPYGTSTFCDKVLEGKIALSDLDDIPFPETIELLQSTMRPPSQHSPPNNKLKSPLIDIELTPQDFKTIFQKWK